MDVKGAIEELEKSYVFKKFKEKYKDHFLSYCFIVIDHQEKDLWQLGYTNTVSNKVHTFLISHSEVKKEGEFDIFKKPTTKILPLKIDEVKTTLEQAVMKVVEFQKKNHPQDSPIKIIVILQTLENIGTIWNITFITQTFKTLNLKLDAKNLEIKESSLKNLVEFEKGNKKKKPKKDKK